jgi:hypothetical protein
MALKMSEGDQEGAAIACLDARLQKGTGLMLVPGLHNPANPTLSALFTQASCGNGGQHLSLAVRAVRALVPGLATTMGEKEVDEHLGQGDRTLDELGDENPLRMKMNDLGESC